MIALIKCPYCKKKAKTIDYIIICPCCWKQIPNNLKIIPSLHNNTKLITKEELEEELCRDPEIGDDFEIGLGNLETNPISNKDLEELAQEYNNKYKQYKQQYEKEKETEDLIIEIEEEEEDYHTNYKA